MGHGPKDVQVPRQVSAHKAIATQITGAALLSPEGNKLFNGLCNIHDKQLCPGP